VLGAVLWALAGPGSAVGAPILSWSPPRQIDRAVPLGHTATLSGVSCPSTTLCVAVGSNLFTSTSPGAGGWRKAPLSMSAVSCPSASLCVGVTQGHVLWSDNPTGGASAWRSAAVDGGRPLTSIACPSAQLCVAADNRGYIVTSTDPTGGAGAWVAAKVITTKPGGQGMHVSCASQQLCVAVLGGFVLSSSNPAGGGSTWSSKQVEQQNPTTKLLTSLTGVTCPAATLCVAIDGAGNVLTSTNPAGAAGAWRLVKVDAAVPLSGVACASASLCVVADQAGAVMSSTNPAGAEEAWSAPGVAASNDECSIRASCYRGGPPPTGLPQAYPVLSCPSTAMCVMVDGFGVVTTSSNPASSGGAWRPVAVDPHTEAALVGVSCASTSLCAAVDGEGNLITSTMPTAGAAAWSLANTGLVTTHDPATGIACVTGTLCVVVDSKGQVITSANPTGGASAWSGAVVSPRGLNAVSCPSASSCVAVGGSTVLSSSNPTGGAAAWHALSLGGVSLSQVSCPSAALCVAVGDDGGRAIAAVSSNPTAATASWRVININDSTSLQSITCPSASLCVATDVRGDVITTDDPSGAWEAPATVFPSDTFPVFVSCPSTELCVATGRGGAATTSNPTGGAGAWTFTPVAPALGPVSCPSSTLCVSVSGGNVITSTTPAANPGSAWRRAAIDGSSTIVSLSCPSLALCVGFDDAAHILSSRKPTSRRTAWNKTHLPSIAGVSIGSIACTSGPLCLLSETTETCHEDCLLNGAVISSSDPTGDASAWTAVGIPSPDGGHLMVAGSCPSQKLCVAVDGAGNVLTSTKPTGPASAWHAIAVGLGVPTDIACPTTTFCAAVDNQVDIATSTRPTGGPGAWRRISLNHGATPASPPAISCPTSQLCAIAAGNTVLTSTNPASRSAWRRVQVNVPTPLTRISCPSPAMCVAVDQSGDVVASSNPTGGAGAWTRTTIDPGHALTSLTCPPGACIAGDDAGNVLVGTSQGVARKPAVAALSGVVHSCSLQRFITVLQRGGCAARMTSPGLGLVTITWLDSNGRTIALGTANTPAGGPLTVHVQLTSAGKRELSNAVREIPVRVVASFQDLPGHRYSRSSSILLLP
jgi:hypothetical protein